jgi:predicted membrane protein
MPWLKSISKFMKYEKRNYRRGGMFMIPGITLGILLAYLFGDTGRAMISISVLGYGTALILFLIGDKSNKSNNL